jgi:hypothetical protein
LYTYLENDFLLPISAAPLAAFLVRASRIPGLGNRSAQVMYAFFRYIHVWHINCHLAFTVQRSVRNFLVWICFFTLASWASLLNASPSKAELCEKLYADYLKRAQQSLSEDKRVEALRFLLDATAIAQKCANSTEQPLPQHQARDSGLAFAANHVRSS